MSGSLGAIDWGVVGLYALGVVGVAVWSSKRTSADHDPFLAGRKVSPVLVAMSLVATAMSSATFLGVPEQSYKWDLTYLIGQVAEVAAILIVAFVFLPRYYKARVTTVYEIIGARYGGGAQRTVSGVFMMGRVLASGSRLFLAALAVALILFGTSQSFWAVLAAVVIISVVACLYTLTGGIRAVIWTDAAQLCVLLLGAGVAIWVLLGRIPLGIGELVEVLRTPDPETGKVKAAIVDQEFSWSTEYSLWTTLTGLLLFNLAAFGTDQDLMQRMLTCSSKGKAAASALLSKVIGFVAVAVFLVLGLLLWVYYTRPDVMGDAVPAVAPKAGVEVFLGFILQDLPAGVRGLVVAGLFAAAMSTMDSTLNALSTTSVCDFYNRWRPEATQRDRERVSKWFVFIWASALSGFAMLCVPLLKLSGDTLLVFVLGVMLYAYTGMLAVFLTAMFTKRGSAGSVVAALVTGFVSVGAMQWGPVVVNAWAEEAGREPVLPSIAMGWRMLVGTVLAFAVCVSVKGGSGGEAEHG